MEDNNASPFSERHVRYAGLSHSPATALALVHSFQHLRVLVIGDVMLDTYFEGSATRLCSEGPVPVVHKTAEYRFPGGAANTAANLSALGAEVSLLGLVGSDNAASVLRSTLRAHGIADRWLVTDEEGSTLHKLRILADGQYVVRFDEGAMFQSTVAQQGLLAYLPALYQQCDLVVISDYRYGAVSPALLELLSALCHAQPKTLVVDSKALHRFRDLPVTVVTPNYTEARLLVDGVSGPPVEPLFQNVERLAQALLALVSTEHVAITLGPQGVFLLSRSGEKAHLPAHPVAHANDVGAGDSFAAALALALGAGGSLQEAAQIGLDAASVAVTRRWTATVQYQELLQRVSVRLYSSLNSAEAGSPLEHAQHLAALLDHERVQGRTVVFTNGVFDVLHAGHVQFLRQAKSLGDLLVVGVNSDRGRRNLHGSGRIVTGERDRLALVAALDMVDYVLLFDEETPEQVIRLLRPAIHVKGGDYSSGALPEAQAVQEVGGRVVILPLVGSMSTDQVKERIASFTGNHEELEERTWGDRR